MPYRTTQISLAAAMVASLAWPAVSQELANEVVNEYFEQLTRNGMTVAPGAVVETGATVEWKDIVVGLPEGIGSYSVAFLRATEITGDKVSITYPDSIKFTIDPKGGQSKMDIALDFDGLSHIVSGAKGARDHVWEAVSVKAAVVGAVRGFSMDLALNNLVGTQRDIMKGSGETAFGNYKGTFKAAAMTLKYGVNEGPVKISSDVTYRNVNGTFDIDEVSQGTMSLLQNGSRAVHVDLTMDSSVGVMDVTQPGLSMKADLKTGKGGAAYDVTGGVASTTSFGENAVIDAQLKNMPMPPLQMKMAKVESVLELQLGKPDEPRQSRIKFGMEGVTLSDTIWGMVDPAGQLPRDAGRLNAELSAKMQGPVDPMNSDQKPQMVMPVKIDNLVVNDVVLEIAGASFKANGVAAMDNSLMFPMPVGVVNLDLKGGIGLLDKLMASGVLPQQTGMMIKGMSGMFAVPGGDGTDHLVSKIERKDSGAILANGMQIR